MDCLVCASGPAVSYRTVERVAYFRCNDCGSIFADPEFIARIERGEVQGYQQEYWDRELASAQERCRGTSIARVAETIRMARIPVRRFIDIGSGSGLLLDSLAELLPELADIFYGIELFPPEPARRTRHPNYRIGRLSDVTERFSAGVCIEVIEHLSPSMLRGLGAELAARSEPGALYYFNSAQPEFVETSDPGYLDPHERGHIVSYSIAGVRALLAPSGFNIIPFPGRGWAFFAEFAKQEPVGIDALFHRLWNPIPDNMKMLAGARFGPLMITIGQESARAYLEYATAAQRTNWALSLKAELAAAARTADGMRRGLSLRRIIRSRNL
jgi:hypothetical protein